MQIHPVQQCAFRFVDGLVLTEGIEQAVSEKHDEINQAYVFVGFGLGSAMAKLLSKCS